MVYTAQEHGAWRERFALLAGLVIVAGVLGAAGWWLFAASTQNIAVAHLRDVPPGTVLAVNVSDTFRDPAPPIINPWSVLREEVPVLLSHDRQTGVLAFFQRDPRSGCLIPWQAAEQLFIDPCHGSAYTRTGEYVRGPSPRSLDQFGVMITTNGTINVNVEDVRIGAERP